MVLTRSKPERKKLHKTGVRKEGGVRAGHAKRGMEYTENSDTKKKEQKRSKE